MVVRQNTYAYQTLINSLTLAQQRALRLAAKDEKTKDSYSSNTHSGLH